MVTDRNAVPSAQGEAAHVPSDATTAKAWAVLAQVPDPEIPVLSVVDLGLVRRVDCTGRAVVVAWTPTYSGCPATEVIAADIRRALVAAGFAPVTLQQQLAPAWTTDWISAQGREALRAYGIAPPGPVAAELEAPLHWRPLTAPGAAPRATAPSASPLGPQAVKAADRLDAPSAARVACPRCGATDTEVLAAHGSTACKALYRCRACREPFDQFKPH